MVGCTLINKELKKGMSQVMDHKLRETVNMWREKCVGIL